MNVTRRDFLKISGATVSGAALGGLGLRGTAMAGARTGNVAVKYAKESTTICPYCAVGCSIIVSAHAGKVVNMEGDPDHPINEGIPLFQSAGSPAGLGEPVAHYQAPLPRAAQRRVERGVLGLGLQ